MLRLLSVSSLVPLLAFATFAGCSAGDVNPPPLLVADGGGTTDGPVQVDAPPGAVIQSGKIIDFSSLKPVAGATITVGTKSATTDASGNYQLEIDPTKITNMNVVNAGYYSLLEQSSKGTTSYSLGKTKFLSENTAGLLTQTLPGYDVSGGVVSVAFENQGCLDEGGATIEFTVDGAPPPAAVKLIYARSGFPAPDQMSAESGSFPHAVIYNVPAGKAVAVTGKHPTCKMKPFPVDKDLTIESGSGTITYTDATLKPNGGKATGFVRIFLTN